MALVEKHELQNITSYNPHDRLYLYIDLHALINW